MNTAWNGAPVDARRSVHVASNESTWRPNALRRTVMSMPAKDCWSGRPSRTSVASMIMPAQEP